MSAFSSPVALDPDDLWLLHDEPELLAIADAFRETQQVRHHPLHRSKDAVMMTRPRTSRRLTVAVAACVAVAVMAGVAVAGAFDLFQGTPATPAVEQTFVSWNETSGWRLDPALGRIVPPAAVQSGLAQGLPTVDPSKAHGVLAVQLSSTVVYQLWAAPLSSGGECSILQAVDLQGNVLGGSYGAADSWCVTTSTPSAPRSYGQHGQRSESDRVAGVGPGLRVLPGRAPGAASVEIQLADGTSTQAPVVEGFFLAPLRGQPRSPETTVAAIIAYNAQGDQVAETRYPGRQPQVPTPLPKPH